MPTTRAPLISTSRASYNNRSLRTTDRCMLGAQWCADRLRSISWVATATFQSGQACQKSRAFAIMGSGIMHWRHSPYFLRMRMYDSRICRITFQGAEDAPTLAPSVELCTMKTGGFAEARPHHDSHELSVYSCVDVGDHHIWRPLPAAL